jgi:hypothetical protein
LFSEIANGANAGARFQNALVPRRAGCYDGRRMIEGTKPYRRRGEEKNSPVTAAPEANATARNAAPEAPAADAANKAPAPEGEARDLGRRAWFRSLVPALGNGLVEILRAGNNLQRDLSDLGRRNDG